MKNVILFLLGLCTYQLVKANLPLTSCDVSRGYMESKWVKEAMNCKGDISTEIMEYLISEGQIAEKIATIYKLGWDENASGNAIKFKKYLLQTRNEVNWTPDDYLCMAYLLSMNNQYNVTEAGILAERAVKMNYNSFTFQIVLSLINAQALIAKNESCRAYKGCNFVRKNGNFKQDMNKESVDAIFEYMDIYKDRCN